MLPRQRQSIPVSGHGSNVRSRVAPSPLHMPKLITEQSSESSGDEERQLPTPSRNRGNNNMRPHPPGFKELHIYLIGGLKTFRRHRKTADDNTRAKWFSWFLTGPAKTTWQCSLKPEDKDSWLKIKQGQYGVHMNPQTAYQWCHGLQYEYSGSVQDLVNSMREYQKMALQKLKDKTLESILWNKIPIELQQELKEIPDAGSVQVLLQKLLRAEAAAAERKWRSKGQKPSSVKDSERTPRKPVDRQDD